MPSAMATTCELVLSIISVFVNASEIHQNIQRRAARRTNKSASSPSDARTLDLCLAEAPRSIEQEYSRGIGIDPKRFSRGDG